MRKALFILGKLPATVTGVGIMIRPRKMVEIQSQAAGKLVSFSLRNGDQVREGGIPGLVDQTEIREQLEQDRSRLAEIEAQGRDVEQAGKDACIHDDIISLPRGYDAQLEEGARDLSGGQRQRLEIARALMNNPSILVLDEATSALDNRTQAIVSKSLEGLKATRIVIAHRLSTIRNADRICVIEKGRIAEEGSFAGLAGQKGLFAHMMARQML